MYEIPKFDFNPVDEEQFSVLSEAYKLWHRDYLKIPRQLLETGGRGIKVAVLDTGVDLTHPYLSGKNIKAIRLAGSSGDFVGHGTHCVGQIVGRGERFSGIAPDCEMLSVKVLGDSGSGNIDNIVNGLKSACEWGADIISMSLGSKQYSRGLASAIYAARNQGRIIFASAGNDGAGGVTYPGSDPNVIGVAAHDRNGRVASFSSRGKNVDITAPGVDILSTVPLSMSKTGFGLMSGTSMAAPIAAGIATLAFSYCTRFNALPSFKEVFSVLKSVCDDAGVIGHDSEYGFGIIDPQKVYDLISKRSQPSKEQEDRKVNILIEIPEGVGYSIDVNGKTITG